MSGSARFTQSAQAPTCEQFAAGVNTDRTFAVPSGISTANVDGQPFALIAIISGFHGPGTYTSASFGEPSTTVLTVDQSSSQSPFAPIDAGASESATSNADGSGSFTFNDWQDPALRSESGMVAWSCQD